MRVEFVAVPPPAGTKFKRVRAEDAAEGPREGPLTTAMLRKVLCDDDWPNLVMDGHSLRSIAKRLNKALADTLKPTSGSEDND